MFLKIILRLTHRLFINILINIYLFSVEFLHKTRTFSALLNRITNKFYFEKKILNKRIQYSKKILKSKISLDKNFIQNISLNSEDYELKYITPLFPYLICDHFLSKELDKNSEFFIFTEIKIKGNDLLKNEYINKIKNFDIVLVQVNLFDFFHDCILPYLELNNIKIILITSQFHFPNLFKSSRTDNCINSSSIILWISQNPIYYDRTNYLAIPFGLDHRNLKDYINYVKRYDVQEFNKKNNIINLYSSSHTGHLIKNHFRTKYKEILCDESKKLTYKNYLREIANSKFLISPTGDREDCYRHYEAIGLGTIPISNASKNKFKSIFKNDMIFLKEKEIISIINALNFDFKYKYPNRDLLLNSYWIKEINKKINYIIKNVL